MPYRQYTECVSPDDYSPGIWGGAFAAGVFAGLLAFVIGMLTAAALGTGLAFGFLVASASGVAVVVFLISVVRWWLYGRLICLGGDRCVIGMVLSIEPRSTGFDTDYSISLLLPPRFPPPLLPGASRLDVIARGVDGNLIDEQSAIRDRSLRTPGFQASSCNAERCGRERCPPTEALHCEFEGAGMQILYDALKVLLALMIAATIGSVLCLIPIFGWIACLIVYILFFIAAQIIPNALLLASGDRASPSDIDPSLELTQNGCDGTGASLVMVLGTWVYDSAHGGWNEIHPIKYCQRIGTWSGVWPFDDPQRTRDEWCAMVAGASSPLTVANQKLPQHQWTMHPLLDGCQPEEESTLI